jgi:hypothetical protein
MSESDEIANILASFVSTSKNEILNYYDRCYAYIRDLFADKNIDLTFKTSYESEKVLTETITTMIKTTNIALSTIGISKKRISKEDEKFKECFTRDKEEYLTYNDYFINDIKTLVDQMLFEVLIEYIIDWDTSKIENLDLFDLLPRKFTDQLDQFKEDFITSTRIKRAINKEITTLDVYLNPSDLTIKGAPIVSPVETEVEVPEVPEVPIVEEKPVLEEVVPPELEDLKMMDIDEIKMSIKKSAEFSTTKIKETPSPPEMPEMPPAPVIPPTPEKPTEVKAVPIVEAPLMEEIQRDFLDYFGRFPSIDPNVASTFNINRANLINSKTLNPEFFDLENLYYYISILKMLNESIPFVQMEITEIAKNNINNNIFSSAKENPPDPINLFYGLAIFSEFGILKNQDIIDPLDIEMFLESELANFNSEKLHLNFYTFLCFKLLQRSGAIITDKSNHVSPILSLDISSLEAYNPILDTFEQLACIRILDREANLSHFKALYSERIKSLLKKDGAIKDTITDSSRALLILYLLDQQKQEFNMTQKILKYTASTTQFFSMNGGNQFNWMADKLAFTIELRMLYWGLLACSQYPPLLL